MKLHSTILTTPVLIAMFGTVSAESPSPEAPAAPFILHAVADLTDGSRIVGTPLDKSLPITLSYANPTVPFEIITRCEIQHQPENITLFLRNGDHISGRPGADVFPLDTILGRITPKFHQIDRIEFSVKSTGPLTEGEGDITFGGVKWNAWRTRFEQQGKRLVSIPEAREGFNYGHCGNGRGAQLITNIGGNDWTDYRIDMDFCVTGIDPAFNPHGLPQTYHSGGISFHVAAAAESWNVAPGTTAYQFSFDGEGTWSLTCCYDSYCKSDVGYGNPVNAGTRTLAGGKGLKLDTQNGNHFRIEVTGTRIAIWVDKQLITDIRDDKMKEVIAGKSLAAGGVGIGWGFESMGWIENFSATRL